MVLLKPLRFNLVWLGFFVTVPTSARISWFIHVTPPENSIRTEIILTNHTPNPGLYNFHVDIPMPRTLAAYDHLVLIPGKDFGGTLVGFAHSDHIQPFLRYTGPSLIAPLTLPPTSESHHYFRYENPGPGLAWKGLVLYNAFHPYWDREVQLVFRDMYGFEVHQITLHEFSDFDKWVQILPEPGADYAYFELISPVPIMALLLSGTRPIDGKFMLNHHPPVFKETNHLDFSWVDGEGSVRELTITPNSICTDAGPCDSIGQSKLTPILEQVQELGALTIRANPPLYTIVDRRVSIFWFGRKNVFSFGLNQEDVSAEARQFTDFLIQVYREAQDPDPPVSQR